MMGASRKGAKAQRTFNLVSFEDANRRLLIKKEMEMLQTAFPELSIREFIPSKPQRRFPEQFVWLGEVFEEIEVHAKAQSTAKGAKEGGTN